MSAATLSLSQSQLESLVRDETARLLEPILPALAERYVAERCQRLTLEEAMRFLRCTTRGTLLEVCRQRRIPILRESRKRQFILLKDIEAADARQAALLPVPVVLTREAA